VAVNAQGFPPPVAAAFSRERSESIGAIAAALAKAQGAMANASKDTLNPHFNRRYADLASVWDAARGPLSANGIAVVQLPEEGPTASSVALVTWLLHASGEWFRGRVVMPAQKADAQGYGSAITYARRYSLAAMIGVAPEEDDGEAAVRPQGAQRSVLAEVREASRARVESAMSAAVPPRPEPHSTVGGVTGEVAAFREDFARIGREGNMAGHGAIVKRVLSSTLTPAERTALVSAGKEAAEAIRHRVTASKDAQAAFGVGSDPMVES
jgi:ERF superfamily